ncbi:MAG: hypothetical protein ACE5Q6_07220 [Dehalococcoidia bacterium]
MAASSSDIANAEAQALAVMEEFERAGNAADDPALFRTFNYPHVRMASEKVAIWQNEAEAQASYQQAFADRAGPNWHHSVFEYKHVLQSSPDKVHLAVQFTRYDRDDQPIATYRSL